MRGKEGGRCGLEGYRDCSILSSDRQRNSLFQRGGGGWARGVQDVQHACFADDEKIVDEASVSTDRLGSNAGRGFGQMIGYGYRDESLKRADEGGFGKRAMHFARTGRQ